MEKVQVLIVDDDKEIANFFGHVLTMAGHDCEVVLNAKDALDRLAATVPDLVLLDLRLGLEVGGEDILYQIRSNPRYDNTRVVVITAYPTIAEMVTNIADLILIKPVDMDQLRTLVSRITALEPGPRQSHFRDPISELYTKEFFELTPGICLRTQPAAPGLPVRSGRLSNPADRTAGGTN